MTSPLRVARERSRYTRMSLGKVLATTPSMIGIVEAGKKRLPDKWYEPLEAIGWDVHKLAIEQEEFIQWRKKFYSDLSWGLTPSEGRNDKNGV